MQARAITWKALAADKFGFSAIGSALNEFGSSPSASAYPRSDLLSTPISQVPHAVEAAGKGKQLSRGTAL